MHPRQKALQKKLGTRSKHARCDAVATHLNQCFSRKGSPDQKVLLMSRIGGFGVVELGGVGYPERQAQMPKKNRASVIAGPKK